MADELKRERTDEMEDADNGTNREADFGRTDRYANADATFVTTGDGTSWDSGRESSIGHGTAAEHDPHSADAETPGMRKKP